MNENKNFINLSLKKIHTLITKNNLLEKTFKQKSKD